MNAESLFLLVPLWLNTARLDKNMQACMHVFIYVLPVSKHLRMTRPIVWVVGGEGGIMRKSLLFTFISLLLALQLMSVRVFVIICHRLLRCRF